MIHRYLWAIFPIWGLGVMLVVTLGKKTGFTNFEMATVLLLSVIVFFQSLSIFLKILTIPMNQKVKKK